MQIVPFAVEQVLLQEECVVCEKKVLSGAPDQILMWGEMERLLHQRCLRPLVAEVGEKDGLPDHLICVGESEDQRQYVRMLAFSQEMGFSDWALCEVDLEGNEVIVQHWSRVEYEVGE